MAFYLLKLIPPRPAFPAGASSSEMEAMGRHADYIRHQIDAGKVFAAGPVMDPAGYWGLAIAEAGNVDELTALCENDPVIRADLGFHWEVLPMASLLAPVV
jgi:uncharacterized protein YciI